MTATVSIAARLATLVLLVGGASALDELSGNGVAQAVVGFALCLVAGVVISRWWALLLPFAVLTTLAVPSAIEAGAGGGELFAGAIVLVMLGSFGATAVLIGVALGKALRREPVAA